MAGDDNGDRIRAVRGADGPNGRWGADSGGDLSVGSRLAVRDVEERPPDLLLKWSTSKVEGYLKAPPLTGEVLVELKYSRFDQGAAVAHPIQVSCGARLLEQKLLGGLDEGEGADAALGRGQVEMEAGKGRQNGPMSHTRSVT